MNDEGKSAQSGTCICALTTAVICCMEMSAGRGRNPAGTRTSLPKAISAITRDVNSNSGASRSRPPRAQNVCVMTASGEALPVHRSSSQNLRGNFARGVEREDLLQHPRFRSFTPRETDYFALLAPVEDTFVAKDPAGREEHSVAFNLPFAPGLSMETLSKPPQYQPPRMPSWDPGGRVPVQLPWRRNGAHRPDDAASVFSPEKRPVPSEGGGPHPYSPMVATS